MATWRSVGMLDDLTSLAAVPLGAGIALVLPPVAVRIARRMRFYDHPGGYKAHGAPTPYLGGAALFAGFAAAALVLGGGAGRFGVMVACALALLALGTFDDRFPVAPVWRAASWGGPARRPGASAVGGGGLLP